jgi:hypothetical protein
MVCIVAVMVFVLLWPTLASAMTGYTPAIKPFVLDIENNLLSYTSFEPVAYIIHDGWRINQTGDYLVSFYKDEHADGNGCKSFKPILLLWVKSVDEKQSLYRRIRRMEDWHLLG